jgi:hypothetical protein
MKTYSFYDLSEEQQEKAIKYAKTTLEDNLDMGMIMSDQEMWDEEIERMATMAAEGSSYTSDGQPIMDPSFFGGCV